ncbi:hypothetical protein AWC38_SpisGene21961 [Stylophora pistillata]|uniref:Ig-like domain-containing protein n=1 Tax=Stylophora pistillata TaxID=50429 RepID=A0A2B4RBP1_STYPI|nr:hypothetical protein AWC38_SpisGene21961 [Stylophora pistillata]
MAEVCLQRVVPGFTSSQVLQAPKGHYVELNFTLETSDEIPCIDDDMYLEFRDGYDGSANLLGRFCGRNISGIVRSSGQNLWLRKSDNSDYLFRVKPNLDKVLKTQYVLFNHHQSLWCPAQGAPAPVIVWRENGTVVQNSTSVLYRLTITGENSDNYSCEVNTQDGFEKKEIRLVIEKTQPFEDGVRVIVLRTPAPSRLQLL